MNIKARFEEFVKAVFPKATPEQRQAMEHGFYAGVWTMWRENDSDARNFDGPRRTLTVRELHDMAVKAGEKHRAIADQCAAYDAAHWNKKN